MSSARDPRSRIRNNSSPGHNFKYYASSFFNVAADLVLEAVGVYLGAPGAPQTLRRSRCGPACALLGNKGEAGTGLACACFRGRQALPESGGEFGAVLPIAVSRTKPIIGGVRFRFFFVFGAALLGTSRIFFGGFPWAGTWGFGTCANVFVYRVPHPVRAATHRL